MSTRTYRRSADIIGPYESGHGKKVYTVHQAKFEVEEYYDVLAAVGFGAYGMVCSALDRRSNRHVAIKKVPHVFEDLVDGLRVVREVKLLATLRHENILHLCDILPPRSGERYEDLYFVTDLFDTDLQQIVRSSQELSHDHRRYFMYQMLQALQHVHSVGVAHRDLKPSNLLVNANCNLVLCDFGLARPLHTYDASNSGAEHEEMTDYVVTRWYRAPELLLLSGRYTERVDTWSVGCIFAELILRKPLFPGRDYVHQIELIASVLGVPGSDRLSVTSCSKHDDASTEQNEKQEARDASCGRDLRFLDSVTENLHAQRYLASMATIATTPLREYLAPESVSVSELDLLEKLLHFIPGHRYSAEQALQHPYFSSLRVAISPMSGSERAATGRKEFTVPIRCLDDPRSPVDTLHRPPFTPECSPSEAALESGHHELAREPSCPSKRWSWNLTREELTVSRLKESLLEEVRRFHPGCDTLV